MKIGDVVKLKSGGDPMTVEEVLENGRVRCVYFNKAGDMKYATVQAVLLDGGERQAN